MKELNIIIKAVPVAKQRPRVTTNRGFAQAYTPKKTKDAESLYRTLIKAELKGLQPLTGALKVDMVFGMPIPASTSLKKRSAMHGKPHTGHIDLDNLIKTILDASIEHKSKNPSKYRTPLLMIDDSQICELKALKVYSKEPFINIVVQELGEVSYINSCIMDAYEK